MAGPLPGNSFDRVFVHKAIIVHLEGREAMVPPSLIPLQPFPVLPRVADMEVWSRAEQGYPGRESHRREIAPASMCGALTAGGLDAVRHHPPPGGVRLWPLQAPECDEEILR